MPKMPKMGMAEGKMPKVEMPIIEMPKMPKMI